MTDIGAVLTILFSILVLVLPRRQATIAFIAAALYITQGQAIEVGDINMVAVRFVELAAALRVVMRKEIGGVSLRQPDVLLILFFTAYMVVTLVRTNTIDAYTLGLTVDGLLVYFVFRSLISTPEDFRYIMNGMVLLLAPFAIMMTWEAIKGQNLFYFMGGIPETPIYREGYYRCQGSFRHAITAGTVGATFFPIFVGFLFIRRNRLWASLGIAACLTIVITSHSSGPLMTTIVAAAAWCCWRMRHHMKWIRLGIVTGLFAMHLLMKAPVWFIFDRISGVIGGDGWHRSNIIDKFVNSISDWWLIGMPMEYTKNWAATVTKSGYADITNYYVSIGISGGLLSLLLFIALLVACFKLVGNGLKSIRTVTNAENSNYEPVLWGIGSAVAAHAVNLLAVSYWDQSYVIWYLHLALAVTLGSHCMNIQASTPYKVN